MDVDYDATVYFLYRKHEGDWPKIEESFRAFLRFAASLGGNEAKQLAHVDPMMYTRTILEHRVEYFQWKTAQRRKERQARRSRRTIPDEELEDDIIFGGKARPSGHNVLKHNLGCSLDQVVESVKTMLPNLAADSDDDSDGEDMPEVFFSGIDWSKVKLPGDEGFSWESPPRDADYNVHPSNPSLMRDALAKEMAEESTERLVVPTPQEVMAAMGGSPPKAAAKPAMNSREVMSKLLPTDVLPTANTYATLQDEMSRLSELETTLAAGGTARPIAGEDLQESLKAGDLSQLKRLLNPSRPKRPSEMKYDSDGCPLRSDDGRSGVVELDSDSDSDDEEEGAAAPADGNLFDQVLAHAAAPGAPSAKAEVKTSIFVDPKPPAAAGAAQQQPRGGRFDAFEHSSDDSDSEEQVQLGRGGKGGYKGGKAGGEYAGKGMKGRPLKP